MRGNEKVIAELNTALSGELTAIVQYIVHSEMCDNWGYGRMAAFIKKQAIDEMRHAEGLVERILFLDGTPQVNLSLSPKIGPTLKAQLDNDLAAELAAVKEYNEAVKVCGAAGDNGTRELFQKMVGDEEQHADFLETQIQLVSEVGLDNYLAQQMHNS